MLKVGILGSGFMGATHAEGWMHTAAQIVGLHSLDVERANLLVQQFDIPRRYDSYEALLNDVDVVDVCTPTHLHYEHVLTAAAAGKHIICEKPLGLTVAQAQEMIAACQKAGVKLLVAHVVRFFPEYAAAKAVVERGEIGKVAVVRLTRASFHPKATAENWFLDPTKSGGMMLDLMIHDFDYARWIAGEVETVFAKSVRSRTPESPDDYGIAILKHTNGALSNVEGGWAYPPPMFRTALEIAGSEGLIEHPAGSSQPLGVYLKKTDSGDSPDVGLPRSPMLESPYAVELRHFYEVLTDPAVTPRVTAEDGMKAVQIARAALESARLGREVKVAEVR
ncbi:MAG: Gfo/Idh/MocA family oxidoreductase [Anaerolineae bacterium]